MNSKNRTLRKAVRLLLKGQLTRSIQLLEPKISLFIDSADYFYLLGRAYFAVGDLDNARLYLKRGLESDPEHIDIQLMLACFAIKQFNTYQAIAIWLKLDSAGCRKTCLRYGLEQIRRINDSEELYNFVRSPKFARLCPPLPGAWRYRSWRLSYRLLLLAALLTAGWLTYYQGLPQLRQLYQEWRQQRQQSAAISLKELDSSEYFSFGRENTVYTFSDAELEKLTSQIRTNYDRYRDNLVQRDINKIFLSNASDKVKTKFRLVESLLSEPEIYSLQDGFSFQQVRESPQLYQNCFVRWQGKPTNIRLGNGAANSNANQKDKLQFTLLVGYTDGTVLEGQVLVVLHDLISVPPDQTLSVFGQVKLYRPTAADPQQDDPGDGAQDSFYLVAKTLSRS